MLFKVSVIIPCYNQGEFIREAMQSVSESDFEDYEIIIVNDGSTDDITLQVFKELEQDFLNKRNVTIVTQENSGLASARNSGIQLARGEYILPLDADDKIRPHYLSRAVEILDSSPEVGVVYPYAQLFGEREGIWEFPQFDPKRLLLHNFAVASSVYRKEIWDECDGYDPEMRQGYEDWEFWIRAMKKGWRFHLIDEVMFDYRTKKDSMVTACNIPENRRHLIRYICEKHRQTYIENLEYVISEGNVELLKAQIRIRSLEAVIRDRESDLNNICNSRGWKALLIAYKARDRIIPLNSRRRRAVKLVFKAFAALLRVFRGKVSSREEC